MYRTVKRFGKGGLHVTLSKKDFQEDDVVEIVKKDGVLPAPLSKKDVVEAVGEAISLHIGN